MTINERIAYAEGRRDEAIKNDSTEDIIYWQGYVQGLIAHCGDLQREEKIKAMKPREENKQ